MKEIFLATDFSDFSKKATEQAHSLAKALNIPLKIIHIFDGRIEAPGPYHSMPGASSLWMKEYIDEARKKGKEALQNLCEELGIKDYYFLEGDPAKKLVAFAKENKIEMLVVGSHGYGVLDRMLLGSVTDYIVRNAPCSIWIVKS